MPTFNLIDEPFIPCLMTDGQASELGLLNTLLKSPDIAEIRDASPLVTVALHRLLLAILHRVYRGPKNPKERFEIRNAKRFDADKIRLYFEQHKDRFDLFHEKYPFYQRSGFST